MKTIISFLSLGAAALLLASCADPYSSNALRTNDGIPIYHVPYGDPLPSHGGSCGPVG